MKKVITFIISLTLVFMLITPIVSCAAEVVSVASEEGSTYHDIFTRVYEWVKVNKSDVISSAGSLAVIIFGAIAKKANSKKNEELKGMISEVGADASGTAKNQKSLIDSYNVMAAGYNEMRAAYEKNGSVEDDRNRLVGACLVAVTALLEMNSTVFVHNKNIPQGVKDLVVQEYANTKKALSDDQLLRAVVESVREKITFTEEAPEDEKQD
ncbi:MAG: hypothetical protein IKJ13_07545 [Clostridia bacterium]|nr:hypothetical protein [Clostridia bacterium]